MTEQPVQSTETKAQKQGPQPTEFALRSLEEVRLFREKIAQPVARYWGLFVADIKQGWNDLRGKPSGDVKVPVLKAAPKNTETLQEAFARMDAAGELDPTLRKSLEKALKREQARTAPRVQKRAILRVAFGNFRHSWKDAFEGMKLRYFIMPNAKKMDPKRLSWTQGKAVTSILGGAAIGGALGFMAFALPYVFLSALYTGGPLIALGIGVRAVGVLIPKGDLKNAVKNIGKKTFATGVACAMWPMVAVGTVAFGAIHATLTTAETLVKGFGASLRAAYDTARGHDSAASLLPAPAADVPAQDFAATAPKAGRDFSQAAAEAAEAQQQAQHSSKPAADKPAAARKNS